MCVCVSEWKIVEKKMYPLRHIKCVSFWIFIQCMLWCCILTKRNGWQSSVKDIRIFSLSYFNCKFVFSYMGSSEKPWMQNISSKATFPFLTYVSQGIQDCLCKAMTFAFKYFPYRLLFPLSWHKVASTTCSFILVSHSVHFKAVFCMQKVDVAEGLTQL